MEDNLRILVVDDHQLMAEGIVGALSQISEGYDIVSFNSCDEAFEHLSEAVNSNPFDILFTDLSFENTDEDTLIDGGESLIRKVREEGIPLKIGVITGHTETNRVFNVITNLTPNAYILKNQCTKDELTFAIQQMRRDIPFYSHEIHQKIMKRNVIQIQMDFIVNIRYRLRNDNATITAMLKDMRLDSVNSVDANQIYTKYGNMIVGRVAREVLGEYTPEEVLDNLEAINTTLDIEIKKSFDNTPLSFVA